MLKSVLLASAALFSTAAHADSYYPIVYDPLHLCSPAGCSSFNGVTIGPSGSNDFGISSSPASQSGVLTLDFLVPTNETFTSPVLNVIVAPSATTPGSFAQIAGTFNSGDLTTFLGFTAAPPNPFSAYIGATLAEDPGATGYTVLQVTFSGSFVTGTTSGQTTILDNEFDIEGLPAGTIVTAFLNEGANGIVSTAQSSSLILGPQNVETPLPASIVFMFTGLVGLIGIGRKWAVPLA